MRPVIRSIYVVLLAAALLAAGIRPAQAGPRRPDYAPVIGMPQRLAVYWHDQRWTDGDFYACALYAQASVLEAFGYDFDAELAAARALGERDGWYATDTGAIGLGQPLRAKGIAFEVFGTSRAGFVPRDRALYRLMRALSAGRYPIVNLDAQQLSYYRGTAIHWHTIWITGMRLGPDGLAVSVIANDSYRGAAVEYAVDEFLEAWGAEALNYYGIFVIPPGTVT